MKKIFETIAYSCIFVAILLAWYGLLAFIVTWFNSPVRFFGGIIVLAAVFLLSARWTKKN